MELVTRLIHEFKIVLCITLALASIAWTGCGKAVDRNEERSVFRMNLSEGLNTLDPAFARSRGRIWMTAQIFNGLVALDSALNVVPSIAKMWKISPDGKTYTFIIRKNIFFHPHTAFGQDSTREVTAEDFVFSFTRICNPQTASTGRWVFNGKIMGLEDFVEGQSSSIEGFQALDDTTFQIRLKEAFPAFLSLLAMPYGYVVPKEVVQLYGEDFRAHPIGTGPFKMYRWEEGNILILHRNPGYFEEDLPYLDAVSISFIPSRLSAFIEFVQGNLDFIGDLDNSYKDEILNLDGSIRSQYDSLYTFILAPQLNTEYLGFQIDPDLSITQNHPLMDVRVRKALNFAIDREKIVSYLLNGMGYPANSGFIPYGMPGFDAEKVKGYKFDPDSARHYLALAGFENGNGFPELTLNSTPEYQAIASFVQKSFENLGISTNIQNLQSGALRKEVYGSSIMFWRASWIADYPDGENYLSLFASVNHAPKGPNTTHFSAKSFDAWYQKSLSITNDSARQALYQRMDQLMMDQAPIIPLYYDRSFRMLQKNWTGLGSNPMNHLFLKSVRRK